MIFSSQIKKNVFFSEISSSSAQNEGKKLTLTLRDDDELDDFQQNDLDQDQLMRVSLESKSRDINKIDSICEYGRK